MRRIVLFFLMSGCIGTLYITGQNHVSTTNISIQFGQKFEDIMPMLLRAQAKIVPQETNIILITDFSSTINDAAPTQILLSLDRQKRIMIIGYFFANMASQRQALQELAPLPVPFMDGYGGAYNDRYIVNASPQSGSFLISIIDRNLFSSHSSAQERDLIKTIDANYYDGPRPSANTNTLYLPAENQQATLTKLGEMGGKYKMLENGNIRIESFGKTILGTWVTEGYIVMTKNRRILQAFYQFRTEEEGINFAKKLPQMKSSPTQVKLLSTKAKFAAVLEGSTFILASPQGGDYRVVLMDMDALKVQSPSQYAEALNTLESAKDLERFTH
ncbi:MAG: hypothetical protein ACRCVN_01290 [Spirochaetia bacterium]